MLQFLRKQIDYLRQFANLRCLCMEGNKVCNHDSYNQHVPRGLKLSSCRPDPG